MDKNPTNAIKRARESAGITQERAAEMTGYSRDSIAAWENGTRRPPLDVLGLLEDVYYAPWLTARYLREQYANSLEDAIPDFAPGEPLPKAVLQLIVRLTDLMAKHGPERLAAIAADGIITEEERPEFDAIVRELQEIAGAAMTVRYAREEGLSCRS